MYPDVLASHRRWIVSRHVDLLVILCGGLLLSLLIFLTVHSGVGFLYAALFFALFADFPHVLQTYSRILFDPQEFKIYRREIRLSLLVIAAVVAYFLLAGEFWFLITVWVYWQPFHVIKQHFGIVSIYALKADYRGSRALTKATLFLGCFTPVLYRAVTKGLKFGDYELMGTALPFSGLSIAAPPVPPSAVYFCYFVFAAALAAFVVEQVRLARSGRGSLPLPALANMGVAIASYNLAYLFVSDLYALILIATAVHSLQYHVLVWSCNNRKFQSCDMSALKGRVRCVALASRRHFFPVYFSVLVGVGALFALSELVFHSFLPLVLVFHHFYMDGIIWKGNRNSELGRNLNLFPAPQGQAK